MYAGTDADPSLAERWEEDAAAGSLSGRLQRGFLQDGLDRFAELEEKAAGEKRGDGPAEPLT